MVSIPSSVSVSEIWERVKTWSADDRRSLAVKIVQSLEMDAALPPPSEPRPKPTGSLADLIGAWRDVEPKHTDDDVRRIVEESILEKHS